MNILRTLNQQAILETSRFSQQYGSDITARLFGINPNVAKLLGSTSESCLKKIADSLCAACFTLYQQKQLWSSIVTGEKVTINEKRAVDPLYAPNIKSYNQRIMYSLIDLIKTDANFSSFQFSISPSQTHLVTKKTFGEIAESLPDVTMPITRLLWNANYWETMIKEHESSRLAPLSDFTRLISLMQSNGMYRKAMPTV
jgi:hypothetical protein